MEAAGTQGATDAGGISSSAERRKALLFLALAGAAVMARIAVMRHSEGSNDIKYWETFAQSIREAGLLATYQTIQIFNHPPLAGFYAEAAHAIASAVGWPFAVVFKVGPFLADLAVAWLFFRFRGSAGIAAGAAAAAAYLWSPVAVLITAHHGNTDSILAAFLFLSVLMADRDRPIAAGMALACAINVKLVAVLLFPVLALHFPTWRGRFKVSAAFAVGAIPFLPVVLQVWPAFSRNALQYNSNLDHWGLPLLFLGLQGIRHAERWATAALELYQQAGRYVIFAAAGIIGWLGRGGRRTAVESGAAVLAAMLVLAPGFGVQYCIWVLPLLMAASARHARPYQWTAGAFLFLTYLHFWTGGDPGLSWFDDTYPLGAAFFGLFAWAVLADFLVRALAQPVTARGGLSTRPTVTNSL